MDPARRQIDTWQAAEINARDWMRVLGFSDARLTQTGQDAGIDIRAHGAVAQVKFEARDVGRPYLQKLVGARGRDIGARMLFFTGAYYTAQAVQYANEMNIALFHYSIDGRLSPSNDAANELVREAKRALKTNSKSSFGQRRIVNPKLYTLSGRVFLITIVLFILQVILSSNTPQALILTVGGAVLSAVLFFASTER